MTLIDSDVPSTDLLDDSELFYIPVDEEEQKLTVGVSKKEVSKPKTVNKYMMFSQKDLENYQSHFQTEVTKLWNNLPNRNVIDNQNEWRRKKIKEFAVAESNKQYKETGENKWKYLPDLVDEFIYEVYGLGDLLSEPSISEIYLDGHNIHFVQTRDGKLKKLSQRFSDPEQYRKSISNWVQALSSDNERFDIGHPEVNLTLPNGDRFHAIGFLCDEPYVTIRKHTFDLVSIDKLVEQGSMTRPIGRFLRAAVKGELNILIAGSTGSGKTTLLRCLLSEIEKDENVIIIEDTAEIAAKKFCKFRVRDLRAREANIEGEGAIPMEYLIRSSLRMNPDRVIVGEVRGAEATPMLLAMSQGNDGSLGTIHADSAKNAITRLQNYMRLYGDKNMTEETTISVIRESLHLILFQKRNKHNLPALHEIIAVDSSTTNEGAAICPVAVWDQSKQQCVPLNNPLPKHIIASLKRGGWDGWAYGTDIE